MLNNYIKIAIRSLLSHRLYSSINLLGLAVGLACCILMSLFVNFELSYDKQFANSDKIARVQIRQQSGAGTDEWPRTGAGWKEMLQGYFPEIVRAGRINLQGTQMEVGELTFNETVSYADKEILDIFSFEYLYGDPSTAFNDINSVILTQSTAKKLFGEENPIGKTVLFFHAVDMKVTGVIKDLNEQTHMSNNSIANIKALAAYFESDTFLTNMFNMNFYTYLEFATPESIDTVDQKLPILIEERFGEQLRSFNVQIHAYLVPLGKIHLYSKIGGDFKSAGDIEQVYLFSAIALLVLLIACINFMNLATARAGQRAKEVGVRKAIGVHRNQIIIQFLSESVILSGISLLIAMALVELTLPVFNEFINRSISFDYFSNPLLLAALISLAIGVGLLAGSYPAFYLSAFSAAKVLKGDVTRGRAGVRFRQGMVIFQFLVATILLISTFAMYQQMQFAKNIKLGYEKDQVMTIYGTSSTLVQESFQNLQYQMESLSGVKWVAGVQRLPGQRLTNNTSVRAQGQEGIVVPYNSVDYNLLENLGVEMVSGRYFNRKFSQDTFVYANQENPVTKANIILNQTAAKRFGWSDTEAIGQTLDFDTAQDGAQKTIATVVGVVKDYHFESVRDEIKPIVHLVSQSRFRQLSLKLDSANILATVANIEETWKKLYPTQNISFGFLDDNFDAMYLDEERISTVYGIFSSLAIIIACLGLFGLASFTTEQRTKEIGVRKVLGASSQSIVILLSTEFSKLVLIASVIAWPIAFYMISEWLQNFAFRIEMGVGVFLIGTLFSLVIAWVTVGGLAAKAAAARPVHSLRYE